MIYLLSITCVWVFLRSQWPLLCHVLGYYALPQLGQFLGVFARGLSNEVSAECETPEKFLVGSMIRSIFSQKVKCLAQVSFLRGSTFFTGNEIKKIMPKFLKREYSSVMHNRFYSLFKSKMLTIFEHFKSNNTGKLKIIQ